MARKAQKPSKAAAKEAAPSTADNKKQHKAQAGSKKTKREASYDSLRDPLDRSAAAW